MPEQGQGWGGDCEVLGRLEDQGSQIENCESLAGRPWAGVHSGSFPSETTLIPSIPNHSLVLDLAGESQGRGSLVGFRLWGRTESDTTETT